ncbi:Laminin G sub domain 2 [Caldithrix abyssi DSM 13497]|uniref:Concanavalin A-like lectin/glucanases superfamily protein n=1 Tax=Caldithrix abyssi DSM 13497 TaxID=880073 RepID=H1XXU8_CALAY|nr:LamG domain-containing protein [Caldithrix abyssi]APF19655.1 Concanavalin A-like lectin/glucanases superfamily protein [Caldithrix abyssi DSM 13497]EHO39771.1 Laminin G sub domain 2 [Caldithrix abyssi DSM 13497]
MRRIALILSAYLLLASCSKNPGEPADSDVIVLNNDVTILEESEQNLIEYVSSERDTIKFNYSSSLLKRFKKEHFIIGQWQAGFAVKITEINLENGQIVLITRPASLTEIFEKCKVDTTLHLSPQQVQKIETLRKGLQVEQPYDDLFQVEINDVTLYDLDGDEYTTHDQLKASGHYSFGIDLDFKLNIDNFQLTYLLFKSTITQTGQLDLYQNVSLLDYENRVDLVKYYLSPITVTVGPVPVVIQPVVRFVVGAEAKFDVQVTSTLIRQESFTSGLEFKNGVWQQISKADNRFDFEPPSLSASGLLKGYAGPQVDLMLYGLLGPYMLVDPYLELEADIRQTPWWALNAGLEVGVGVHLELFDQTLADVFYPKVIDLKETVASATTGPPEDNTQPRLIAYYPFNGNAKDESGFGNDGTVYGASLTSDRFGNVNSAYRFDGYNDYIEIPNYVMNNLSKGTFSAWIKMTEINRQNGIIDKTETYNTNYFQLIVHDNNQLRLNIDVHYGETLRLYSNSMLDKNTWYHVVVTWDGNYWRIYLNGKLDAQATRDRTVPDATRPILIGKVDGNRSPMKGAIDDIRIYNYVLSDNEINNLYHENGW